MQAVLEDTESAPQPGTCLGPYELIKHVKQGGMSAVYLGKHLLSRAYVAIKVVDSSTVDLNMVYRVIFPISLQYIGHKKLQQSALYTLKN